MIIVLEASTKTEIVEAILMLYQIKGLYDTLTLAITGSISVYKAA